MYSDTQQVDRQLITIKHPRGFSAEEFKTIRSNIQFSMLDKQFSSIIVTSSNPNEGKSFISANIAVVLAAQGTKVLLVDTDLRNPSLYRTFQIPNIKGVTTLLRQDSPHIESAVYPTTQENLDFLPSGPVPPNPSELIASSRMNHLIDKLKDIYDLVIFDVPPIVTVADAQIMAGKTDGTIFVVRNGKTDRSNILKAKQLLEHANANIIGTIFNGKKQKKTADYANYYYQ